MILERILYISAEGRVRVEMAHATKDHSPKRSVSVFLRTLPRFVDYFL
jgi:hypothetical protein